MPTTADCDCEFVSKEWLLAELRSCVDKLVILDCRSSNEYGESHIRDAVNFSIPSIMLRRLAAGKIDLLSTIKCRELKNKISSAYKDNLFVLYNDLCDVQLNQNDSTLGVLLRRLTQDGCRVVCLEGKCSVRSVRYLASSSHPTAAFPARRCSIVSAVLRFLHKSCHFPLST